jgi:hypothetical protein
MSLPGPHVLYRFLMAVLALAAGSAVMADDAASVVVIRGGEVGSWSESQSSTVVVMRPASGSFLRESTRLAADAEAREERLARERERETSFAIAEALRALQATAYASASMTSADAWWPVFLPVNGHRSPPPSRPRAPVSLSMPNR